MLRRVEIGELYRLVDRPDDADEPVVLQRLRGDLRFLETRQLPLNFVTDRPRQCA